MSDTYSNTQSGVYIGMDTAFTGDSHYVIKDSDATITMIAPVANYGGQYTVNGNVQFDLYAGTYKDLFGIVRNGLRGTYQTLNGDVTYNIFGGNYNKIHTGSTYGGNINGNVVFNFYGGNFSSDIKLGDYNQYANDGKNLYLDFIDTMRNAVKDSELTMVDTYAIIEDAMRNIPENGRHAFLYADNWHPNATGSFLYARHIIPELEKIL